MGVLLPVTDCTGSCRTAERGGGSLLPEPALAGELFWLWWETGAFMSPCFQTGSAPRHREMLPV